MRGFVNRGGFSRSPAFLVVYLALYPGAGLATSRTGGHFVDDDLLSSVGSVLPGHLPTGRGALALHGLTESTTILATGAVDKVTERVSSDGLLTAAGGFPSSSRSASSSS